MGGTSMTTINRRNLIGGAFALIGVSGTAVLSAWGGEIEKAVWETRLEPGGAGRFFTGDELNLLREVADMIIPETDTPGASAVNVHGYIDSMLADWASGETQAQFRKILSELGDRLVALSGKPFAVSTYEERFMALKQYDKAAFGREFAQQNGYRTLKQLIVQVYYLSEVGATIELRYELNPGDWQSCIPFEEVGRSWAI